MKLKYPMLLIFLFAVAGAKAQYSNKIYFRNISTKDGLSFPVINCIMQDQDGFIWIGTEVGLNRYDGQKFKVYYADPSNREYLSNDNITCLFEGPQKRLWIGTHSGLNIFDREEGVFHKFEDDLLREAKILAITTDGSGNYIVLTQTVIIRINHELTTIQKYSLGILKEEELLTQFSSAATDQAGNTWINTNRGLRKFDPQTLKLSNPFEEEETNFIPNIEFFSTIHFDELGNIWVASRGNGLKQYNPDTGCWKLVKNLSSNYINGITFDINKKVWVGTGRNGLNIYDPITEKVEIIRYAEKPESNFVSNSLSCIFADNQGGIWIGTFNNGIQYYFQHQLNFNLFYSEGQLRDISSNYTTAFAVDSKDNIWIGAADEGLLFFDRKKQIFQKIIPELPETEHYGELKENFYVLSLILSEDEEHLFIGTLTGIYDFHIPRQQWKYFHHNKNGKNSLSSGQVSSMCQSGDNIFVANYEGVAIYNYPTGKITNLPQPVPGFQATSLIKAENTIIVGSRFNGLWKLDNALDRLELVASQDPKVKLPQNIRSLLLDKQKRLLIGSYAEGLTRTDLTFSKLEQLGSFFEDTKLSFMSLTEDPRSGYWVATNCGLARISERLEIQKLFDRTEGFNPEYFTQSALYKTSANEILVGGNLGFYSFFPDNFFSPNNAPVEVHLTDFLLMNKSVLDSEVAGFTVSGDLHTKKTINLPQYRSLLTFEYAALDFHNPSRINYAYRLVPYEGEWNEVGNRRYATYRDLPPGTYHFQVRLQEDTRQQEWASLKIVLPPKPWLSAWAYLLYGSILFLLGRQWLLYRKNKRKLRQEVAMQKFQKEKIEELYTFKIDFFTQMTHELRTPLTLILAPLEEILARNKLLNDRQLIDMVHRNSQKLLYTVNKILDFRKIENSDMRVFAKKGNIVAFAEEIFYSFSQQAEQKGIELRFETNMEAHPYVLFDKDIMEKILVNLIANALKFTQTGTISLALVEEANVNPASHFLIRIQDSGRGIFPENLPFVFDAFFQEKRDDFSKGSGLGLKIVKELTHLHHGTIEVNSQIHIGTTFCLSFPKADLDLMEEDLMQTERLHWQEPPVSTIFPETHVEPSAKILIVDDEPEILDLVQEIFKARYQVLTANTAQKAIPIAHAEMPDIIISDVMMPEMDGYKLCEYTKSDFLLRHIPVILLTALKKTENEIEGLNTGADTYISKPFSVELLKAAVQNLLSSRQQLKQAFLHSGINKSNTGKLTDNNSDQKLIEKIITLIESKLEEATLETTWIAHQMGMSPSTFYRKLKSLTGLSGNEFIRTVRLKRALDLLHSTDMNISEIAYQVGFSDPKYFATCFKKQFHATPSEYVSEHRST